MNLYDMKHNGTGQEIASTREAWENGRISPGVFQFTPCLEVTSEVVCALPGHATIFNLVYFLEAEVKKLMPDGRLKCQGFPVVDPDPLYRNDKNQREFEFYILVSKGCIMTPEEV